MPRTFRLLALASLVLAGCHAEVQTKANVSASAGDDDHKWESGQQESWSAPPGTKPAAPPPASDEPTPGRAPFIGVTPDLTLASGGQRTASCLCLAVASGQPGDAAFRWQGGVPGADADTMAVAISGEGVPCEWKPRGPHRAGKESEPLIPSIAAVEASGNDVVVTVEAARLGRPVAHGAMVRRPGPGGALVIRGRGRVPFGHPAGGGKGTCRLAVAR